MARKVIIMFLISMMFSLFAGDSGYEIVKKTDEHRSVSSNFEFTVELEYFKNNLLQDKQTLKGFAREGKSMVQFMEPSNMKGRKLLTVTDDMWMFFPNTKRPVRISAAQKLMGGFSNGDIAKTSFAEDFEAVIIGEEEAEKRKCIKLELKAKRNTATYNKIILWTEKSEYFPVKAEFYALSGKKLKTGLYSGLKTVEGKKIATILTVYDAVVTSEHSVMTYTGLKSNDVPEKYFNKDYLERM